MVFFHSRGRILIKQKEIFGHKKVAKFSSRICCNVAPDAGDSSIVLYHN